MNLAELPRRPADWDRSVESFDTKTLFHESCWLDHLQTLHPRGRIDYFQITDGGRAAGYFCAQRIRKLLLPIYGSPLGGTNTNFMGPAVNHDIEQSNLVHAIRDLVRKRGSVHLEMSHDWLRPEIMEAAGFQIHPTVTNVCRLPDNVDEAWKQLHSTCRNRVRKARKGGLVAEITKDPRLVECFYEQFREVYAKQGMVTPYEVSRPRSLFEHLLPADRLLPVWVKQDETVVAAGLFPYDERCIYFWGAASWLRFQRLCPNELLHWTVIEAAVQRGIPMYNMCGGRSQFKNKFGGSDVPYINYSFSANALLKGARRVYRQAHFARLKVLGRWSRRPERPPRAAAL